MKVISRRATNYAWFGCEGTDSLASILESPVVLHHPLPSTCEGQCWVRAGQQEMVTLLPVTVAAAGCCSGALCRSCYSAVHGARCSPGGVQGRRHPSRVQGVRHADDGGNLLPEDQWKVSHQPAASEFTFRHSWEVFLIPQGFSLIAQKWRRTAPPFFFFFVQLLGHLFRTLCENFSPRSPQVRSPGQVK